MMRMGIVWRDADHRTRRHVASIVTRNVREGSIDDLVCAAEVSGLDGDLVDPDGRFVGRILVETGRLPVILLTESP